MKLGLGTAQFGSDYGITNSRGQVSPREVVELLHLAADSGITLLDTAAAYGESETALGNALWRGHPFSIVTKCAPIRSEIIRSEDVRTLRDGFLRSLERLRQPSVYGLLLHRPGDLGKPGGELLAGELAELKRQRLVSRLGASFYGAAEIASASAILPVEIAQVPVSIADQRLVADGTLRRLHAAGCEVHARSIFLQGLLLAERIPEPLASRAEPLRRIAAHARARGTSPLALAVAFAAGIPELAAAIVGVSSSEELREVLAAVHSGVVAGDVSALAVRDEDLLNPSRWAALGVSARA